MNKPGQFGKNGGLTLLGTFLFAACFCARAEYSQQAYLKPATAIVNGNFARVTMCGETVAVGGTGYQNVFVRAGASWIRQAVFQNSVGAVALDGDTLVVSGNEEALVYVRNGTNWLLQARLQAANGSPGDAFGTSVAISGDTVVVGAPWEGSGVPGNPNDNSAPDSGAAYVFVRSGTNWSQQAYLKASYPDGRYLDPDFGFFWLDGDWFGSAVAISGDTIVVGALYEASDASGVNGDESNDRAFEAGAAYVFVRTGTTWNQQAYLKASNPGGGNPDIVNPLLYRQGDYFGGSVAISGDTIVVGANGEDSNATGVNSGGQGDNSGTNAGAAYVFVRVGGSWTQQAYLKASNTGLGDFFGSSVAVSGKTIVVGAPGESSNATAVNTGQNDNSAGNSGAAYVFSRVGNLWTPTDYLKPLNTDPNDNFGAMVSVWGETIAVGAPGEKSNATEVDGDHSNNSLNNAGAAYIFDNRFGLTFAFDRNEAGPCDLVECTATVSNNFPFTLEEVFPVASSLTFMSVATNLPVRILTNFIPAASQTVVPGGTKTFKWYIQARWPGSGRLSFTMRGVHNGDEYFSGATSVMLVITNAPLIVNKTGDEPDLDPTDACCDVDPNTPGSQCTLRAAIQTANATPGKQTILFDLPVIPPTAGGPTISPLTPYPAITEECEILGSSQPAGGWVEIDGAGFSGQTALELQGNVKIRGLAFTRFANSVAVHLSGISNTVEACRFGLTADGQEASGNSKSLHITSSYQKIGGDSALGKGNVFGADTVSIRVEKPSGGVTPSGIVIEGNEFGRLGGTASDVKGPVNAIDFRGMGSRIGGITVGARNRFVSCRGAALVLQGIETTDNDVIGNWFGLTPAGTAVTNNQNGYGIAVAAAAHHNRIGGSSAAKRNIVSGCNDAGIIVSTLAHDNAIEGNWIGLAENGLTPARNGVGVWMVAGYNNRIGGTSVGQRNVISGNSRVGIRIGRALYVRFRNAAEDPGDELCIQTYVQGNWVGLNSAGTHAVPNGSSRSGDAGIEICELAYLTHIGGALLEERNIISGNNGEGVLVRGLPETPHGIWGNYIGTSVNGASAIPNRKSGLKVIGAPSVQIGGLDFAGQPTINTIAYNAGPGIDLSQLKAGIPGLLVGLNLIYDNEKDRNIALGSKRVPNDFGDGDPGPNGLQNWPRVVFAVNSNGASTTVRIDMSEFTPGVKAALQVFRHRGGGGDELLWGGLYGVQTNNPGFTITNNLLSVELPLQPVGTEITALATGLGRNGVAENQGTSQFSPPVKVFAGTDSDGDGVPDALEDSPPAATPGDRNADGQQDKAQPNVSSVELHPENVSGQTTWLTVVMPPGRTIAYRVALTSQDLPSLPENQEIPPGAVHLNFTGGTGGVEVVQFLLPPEGNAPTVWLWQPDGTWIQLNSTNQLIAGLRSITFSLPAAPPGTAWTVALGQPRTSAPPLQLSAGPLQWQTLPRPQDEPVPGFLAGASPSLPPPQGMVLTVQIPWPTNYSRWILQRSTNLLHWEDLDITLLPGESVLQLAYPPSEPQGFFRWRYNTVSAPNPSLRIFLAATNAAGIAWFRPANGWKLQSNPNLATTNWTDVTNAVNIVGDENQSIISPAVGNRFFRLNRQ